MVLVWHTCMHADMDTFMGVRYILELQQGQVVFLPLLLRLEGTAVWGCEHHVDSVCVCERESE